MKNARTFARHLRWKIKFIDWAPWLCVAVGVGSLCLHAVVWLTPVEINTRLINMVAILLVGAIWLAMFIINKTLDPLMEEKTPEQVQEFFHVKASEMGVLGEFEDRLQQATGDDAFDNGFQALDAACMAVHGKSYNALRDEQIPSGDILSDKEFQTYQSSESYIFKIFGVIVTSIIMIAATAYVRPEWLGVAVIGFGVMAVLMTACLWWLRNHSLKMDAARRFVSDPEREIPAHELRELRESIKKNEGDIASFDRAIADCEKPLKVKHIIHILTQHRAFRE